MISKSILLLILALLLTTRGQLFDDDDSEELYATSWQQRYGNLFRRHRSLPDDKECTLKCAASSSGIVNNAGNRRSPTILSPDRSNIHLHQPTADVTAKTCNIDQRMDHGSLSGGVRERAVCPFRYVVNHDKKRVPATIVSVECECGFLQSTKFPNKFDKIRCEPHYYQMRVLMFDDGCAEYKEEPIRIAMSCVPVFQKNNAQDPLQAKTATVESSEVVV